MFEIIFAYYSLCYDEIWDKMTGKLFSIPYQISESESFKNHTTIGNNSSSVIFYPSIFAISWSEYAKVHFTHYSVSFESLM